MIKVLLSSIKTAWRVWLATKLDFEIISCGFVKGQLEPNTTDSESATEQADETTTPDSAEIARSIPSDPGTVSWF